MSERLGRVADRTSRLLATGRTAEAEQVLREALADDPGHAGLLATLARVVLELGRPDEAESLARAAAERAPGNAVCLISLGWVLLGGRTPPGEVLAVARQGIELAPNNPEGYRLAARCLAAQPRYQAEHHAEARHLIERALGLAPHDVDSLLDAGRVEVEHDAAAAARHYRAALQLDPMNTDAKLGLAVADGGEGIGPARLARSALAEDPHNAQGRWILAATLSSAVRRVAVVGARGSALALLGVAWVPGPVPAVLALLLEALFTLAAAVNLAQVLRLLPSAFVRDELWSTPTARATTAACTGSGLASFLGALALLVGGLSWWSAGSMLLGVAALAPVSRRYQVAGYAVAAVPGREAVPAAAWRVALRPVIVMEALAAVTAAGAVLGAARDVAAAALLLAVIAGSVLPVALVRLSQESRPGPDGRRRPSTEAVAVVALALVTLGAGAALPAIA